jgi:aminopeptidase N
MQLAETLTSIDKLFDGSDRQPAWRAFARERLEPAFKRVGWPPAPNEGETTGRLREKLIRALSRFEDPEVIAEARRRFARAATDRDALPASIREATIEVVARHADEATWNELRARAKAASEPIEKERLFEALGRVADPALVSRALALALSGEVRTVFVPGLIATAAEEHPRLVFDFAVENEKAVLGFVESSSRWAFIPELAQTSGDAAMVEQVRAYADRSIPKDARQEAQRVIADINFRAEVKARQLPALEAWMQQSGERAASST